jgi:hypothetical protein
VRRGGVGPTVPQQLTVPPRSIGCEKVADAEQWRRRRTIRVLERSYFLSGRPATIPRASGNARSASDEKRIEFRIGINVGDIIIDRGDIFGDGVNVAARMGQLRKSDPIRSSFLSSAGQTSFSASSDMAPRRASSAFFSITAASVG